MILHTTRTRPAAVVLIERWKSVAALEAHLKQAPHASVSQDLCRSVGGAPEFKILLPWSDRWRRSAWPMLRGASRRSGKISCCAAGCATSLDSRRASAFIELNDGSCQRATCKVVAPADLANYESEIKKLPTGASVANRRRGPKASPAKGQPTEVQRHKVNVIGLADPETFPLSKDEGHTFEFLRMIAHLRPRTNTFGAIARLRNQVCKSIHDFFLRTGLSDMFTRRLLPPVIAKEPARCFA